MRYYLEIQVETAVHRFVMKDRDVALANLELVQPHVGKPMFSRNDDAARNLKILSEDGEAFVSTEGIRAARITDYDVFEAHENESRQQRHREARQIDIELIERMRS